MGDGRRITRKTALVAAGVAAAGATVGAVLGTQGGPSEPRLAKRFTAAFRRGDVPSGDPGDGAWLSAEAVAVALVPQQIVPPYLHVGGLEHLTVRALHNARELAFLLEWEDPVQDELDGIGVFHDACAVQLPVRPGDPPPPVMMGAQENPVHILQWRAAWQRDLAGKTGPADLHPRVIRDLLPEQLLGPEAGLLYYPARDVGNPLAAARRTTPVEEVVAEGFGTVTHLAQQRARGAGVWAEGRWRVAVSLPMERPGVGAAITPGSAWAVSFAVWRGDLKNRGARKHWADWVRCDLEAAL